MNTKIAMLMFLSVFLIGSVAFAEENETIVVIDDETVIIEGSSEEFLDNETGNTTAGYIPDDVEDGEIIDGHEVVPTGDDTETNETDVDEETQEEVETIYNEHGAEVRLLQLQLAIEKNILRGNKIIEEITALNSTADTSELQAILAELQLVKDEVAAINASAVDTEQEKEDAAQQFVELKKDSIELSKQFRDTCREIVKDAGIRAQIKSKVMQYVQNQLGELKEQLKENVKKFNAARVRNLLKGKVPQEAEELAGEVESGLNITAIKQKVKEKIENLANNIKKQFLVQVKETLTKTSVGKNAVVEKFKNEFQERKEERLTNRQNAINSLNISGSQVMEKLAERIGTGLNKIEQLRERLRNPLTGNAVKGGNRK